MAGKGFVIAILQGSNYFLDDMKTGYHESMDSRLLLSPIVIIGGRDVPDRPV